MPALALAPLVKVGFAALKSQIVRTALGARLWGLAATGLRWLGSALARFGGFILGTAVSFIADSLFTTGLETVQESIYVVSYFDWNQSDNSIKQQIESNNLAMIQLAGRFVGSGVVRITSVGVAAGASMRYPVIAGRVAKVLAEDTRQTVRGDFIAMVQGLRELAVENALLSMVLAFRQRRWFGQEPRPEDGPVSTIAGAIDERVQAIDEQNLRSFVMGALEGAEDAFWDVGYIVSMTLDDIVAANQFSRANELGPTRAVKVTLDANNPDEAIVLSGPESVVQNSLETTLVHHQLIHNRDVGQIVGIPSEHYARARIQSRILAIRFKSKERPPYKDADGRRSKEIQYTVCDAKPGLTWAEIKTAARRFTWGPWRATALLDNNRQMACYGVSGAEAEQQLRSLITLSMASLVTLTVSEEKIRNPAHVKRPTMMYPAYATLVSAPSDFQGVPVGGSRAFRRNRRRITLWTDTEPDDLGPLA